jgi:hypothetical protein
VSSPPGSRAAAPAQSHAHLEEHFSGVQKELADKARRDSEDRRASASRGAAEAAASGVPAGSSFQPVRQPGDAAEANCFDHASASNSGGSSGASGASSSSQVSASNTASSTHVSARGAGGSSQAERAPFKRIRREPAAAASANAGSFAAPTQQPNRLPQSLNAGGTNGQSAGAGGGSDGLLALNFGPFADSAASLARTVAVPDTFVSAAQYAEVWGAAVTEEANLMLQDLSQRFAAATSAHYCLVRGAPKGAAPARDVAEWLSAQKESMVKILQASCRKANVPLYGRATLKRSGAHQSRFGRKRGGDEEAELELTKSASRIFMTLPDKEHHSQYSRDTLFIVCQSLSFVPSRLKPVGFLRALWHGLTADSVMEVSWLGEPVHLAANKDNPFFVIRGPCLSSELAMADALALMREPTLALPILPTVLAPERSQPAADAARLPAAVSGALQAVIRQYKLNGDQARVLEAAASWWTVDPARGDEGEAAAPVLLVHGVFGAGKSLTLRALAVLLTQLSARTDVKLRPLSAASSQPLHAPAAQAHTPRIIIAGYTNKSVDNVLAGLLDHGFEDFARVGSLKAIARRLVPYVATGGGAHGKENGDADAIKDLREILKEPMSAGDRATVQQTLDEMQSGRRGGRADISAVNVIGVTCLSAHSPVLDAVAADGRPSIVLMDECSQMLEPMSAVALARFRAARLVCVGDPKQLPPTLTGGRTDRAAERAGLGKTLFSRLAAGGLGTIMLRTQYRCHPAISGVVNPLFYDGQLLDAPGLAERPPVAPCLGAAIFVDTSSEGPAVEGQCAERALASGSFVNNGEANICVQLVAELLGRCGLGAEQVGVICLYKAQAQHLRQKLEGGAGAGVEVSTVDAFQGGEKDVVLISCSRTSGKVRKTPSRPRNWANFSLL